MGFFNTSETKDRFYLKGYLTGHILVASPFMDDARFLQSVIYICGHDEQGAMGFILNKPLPSLHFQDLMQQLALSHDSQSADYPIHYGGPVEVGRGFVLHSTDYIHPATVKINDSFCITATLEILKEISEGKGPQFSFLALGYTGWSATQLEQEIQNNQWFVLKGTQEFISDNDSHTMWAHAYGLLGIDPHFMMMDSGRA